MKCSWQTEWRVKRRRRWRNATGSLPAMRSVLPAIFSLAATTATRDANSAAATTLTLGPLLRQPPYSHPPPPSSILIRSSKAIRTSNPSLSLSSHTFPVLVNLHAFILLWSASALAANFARVVGLSVSDALEFLLRSAGAALPQKFVSIWNLVRTKALAPALTALVVACLVMSVMLMVEVISMAAVSLAVKLLRCRPEKRYKWEPIKADEETGSLAYPMVLVQIPMYNEREVNLPAYYFSPFTL